MSLRLIIGFEAESAAAADKLVQAMAARCPSVQQEPGCLQFEVFRSALQPERYVLLEHWASQQALDDFHEKSPTPPDNPAIKRTREHYEYLDG
jgi:quinol monooxygenase YgiN